MLQQRGTAPLTRSGSEQMLLVLRMPRCGNCFFDANTRAATATIRNPTQRKEPAKWTG